MKNTDIYLHCLFQLLPEMMSVYSLAARFRKYETSWFEHLRELFQCNWHPLAIRIKSIASYFCAYRYNISQIICTWPRRVFSWCYMYVDILFTLYMYAYTCIFYCLWSLYFMGEIDCCQTSSKLPKNVHNYRSECIFLVNRNISKFFNIVASGVI